jgi:hypothetical protein|tara:strand:+ start:675 stop:1247 length:573 start_codon:yes stop_codon:yes gene_type:complete
MNDFIGVYPTAFGSDYCDNICQSMDSAFEHGYGVTRRQSQDVSGTTAQDTQIFAQQVVKSSFVFDASMGQHFNDIFWGRCYSEYAIAYPALKELPDHRIYGNKLQKTRKGEGYHAWHSEQGPEAPGRILSYIVYLNDVVEGGETEFIYQHKRVKPETGTVVIWPAGFTHTHRGNPPLSNSKYIMTGWVEY